ncbi:MAG: hypothetical protein IJ512_08985 [Ruminococcus sp.]|nr:hypothetical protein [Ruminococcus sp.]
MMRNVLVYLYDTDGHMVYLRAPLRFVFRKEKYTPCTELDVTVQYAEDDQLHIGSVINRVRITVEGYPLHDGIIDQAEYRRENGAAVVTVRSRGFTALLLNNEMTPGIHTAMSLDKLMTEYYTFPVQVQWEANSDASNYIYVKPHRSMWDSVVNLGYKLYGSYPYIYSTNQIRLSAHKNPETRIFSSGEILSAGFRTTGSRLLSHLHMQDIEGNYDTYQLENPDAAAMHIVRHKQMPFDRQYLYDPEQSMNLTFALAAQGWRAWSVTYGGYVHLDLNDYAGAEGVFAPGRISALTVKGDASGLKSIFTVYEDAFSEG